MRYLTIWRPAAGEEGAPPDPAHMAAMGKLVEEAMASGQLINTEPLAPRASGARVTLSGGRYTVSDETERAGGYAFLNAASREEAIEFCKQFMGHAGDGVVELRQVLEFGPPPG